MHMSDVMHTVCTIRSIKAYYTNLNTVSRLDQFCCFGSLILLQADLQNLHVRGTSTNNGYVRTCVVSVVYLLIHFLPRNPHIGSATGGPLPTHSSAPNKCSSCFGQINTRCTNEKRDQDARWSVADKKIKHVTVANRKTNVQPNAVCSSQLGKNAQPVAVRYFVFLNYNYCLSWELLNCHCYEFDAQSALHYYNVIIYECKYG